MEHIKKKKTIYGLNLCKCAIKVASAKCVCGVMWCVIVNVMIKRVKYWCLVGFLYIVCLEQDFK